MNSPDQVAATNSAPIMGSVAQATLPPRRHPQSVETDRGPGGHVASSPPWSSWLWLS